jgi:predicted nucleotidyltransferase
VSGNINNSATNAGAQANNNFHGRGKKKNSFHSNTSINTPTNKNQSHINNNYYKTNLSRVNIQKEISHTTQPNNIGNIVHTNNTVKEVNPTASNNNINEKAYVTNLVKNMVDQIITEESNKLKVQDEDKQNKADNKEITKEIEAQVAHIKENIKPFAKPIIVYDKKISSINHQIIPEKKNKMVDNYSQTDKKENIETTQNLTETDSDVLDLFKEDELNLTKSHTSNFIEEDKKKQKKTKAKPNTKIYNNFKVVTEKKANKGNDFKKSISEQFTNKSDIEYINTPTNNSYKQVNTSSFKKPQYGNTTNDSYYGSSFTNQDEDDLYGKNSSKFSRGGSNNNNNSGYFNTYNSSSYYYKKNKFTNNNTNTYNNTYNNNTNNKFGNDNMIMSPSASNNKISGRTYYGRNDYYFYDEPKVYNNYYIINSNVNINNVGNGNTNNYDKDTPENGNNTNNPTVNPSMYYGDLHQPYPFYYNSFNNKDSSSFKDFNYDILAKIDEDIYPFIFHYKIHNDILDYSNTVNETHDNLKEVKLYIINYIENIIKQCLGDVVISIYGSFATNLCIESSDIDMTIKFQEECHQDQEEIINKLCEFFRNFNFDNINPIVKAAVPIIKLVVDPMRVLDPESQEFKKFKSFKFSEIFRNYPFDLEDLLKVKVDLTILEYNSTYNTKVIVDWAKKSIDTYPEIKPVIHVLKRYLQIRRLNSSFNGI